MKRIVGIFAVMMVTACGRDITAPTFSHPHTQIVGSCWVSKDVVDSKGVKYIVSAHYSAPSSPWPDVCPPLALVDSLGEYETVNHP